MPSRFHAARAAAALPALLLILACGSSSSSPSATSSPAASNGVSRNMTLLSRVDLSTMGVRAGAGNWGYTTPDGRRLALTGTTGGLSIVDVSDPARPRNLGLIPGEDSQWREVKTFGHYAYVTTEARTGLDIVDLSNPDQPRKVQTWNKTFTSAHTVWADADNGLLFVNGANGRNGGMHVLDVGRDPEDPDTVGIFTNFYIHDSYRRGNVLYASAINDGFLGMLDVSDPSRIREISRFPTGGRFTHNSWLTGDGRYIFTTDERSGRPLEGWDILDPLSPRKVSEYLAREATIPHNVMIDGTRMVVSHYTEGVRLLDVSNPERPTELGFYDTFGGTSGGFAGAWGAYIFPGSNLILVSDINSGLWVIRYDGP
jgi:choice-of-anchor B domain-containing protein